MKKENMKKKFYQKKKKEKRVKKKIKKHVSTVITRRRPRGLHSALAPCRRPISKLEKNPRKSEKEKEKKKSDIVFPVIISLSINPFFQLLWQKKERKLFNIHSCFIKMICRDKAF